jgi:hypothetical protein
MKVKGYKINSIRRKLVTLGNDFPEVRQMHGSNSL